MTATHHTDRERAVAQSRHWHARVAVRVPRGGNDDLVGNASRRLERPSGIESVTVEQLCGLEPALSATVVRVELRAEASLAQDEAGITQLLSSAPGTEQVETLATYEPSE